MTPEPADDELVSHWAIPLSDMVPLTPAAQPAEPMPEPLLGPLDDVTTLDATFQALPSEGFFPTLFRRKKAA